MQPFILLQVSYKLKCPPIELAGVAILYFAVDIQPIDIKQIVGCVVDEQFTTKYACPHSVKDIFDLLTCWVLVLFVEVLVHG